MNADRGWLTASAQRFARRLRRSSRRELHVKSHLLKTGQVQFRKVLMPIHRRRFRVEEAAIGDMPLPPSVADEDAGPMHREIMNELRAIRSQMAAPVRGAAADTATQPSPEGADPQAV